MTKRFFDWAPAFAGVTGLLLAGVVDLGVARAAEPAAMPGPSPAAMPGPSPAAMPGPSEVVQQAAEAMLKDLDANRAAYQKDPQKVSALVEQHLLPHFDTAYAARLVLGRHWRTATPEQRQKFVDAFYNSLVRNYGGALADFTGDRLKVYPSQIDSNSDRATVRTEVKKHDGTRVPVNYSLHKTPDGWKAWDVVIEGISYVKSFRDDFGAEIDAKGLDAVIERIENGANPVEEAKAQRGVHEQAKAQRGAH